MVGAAVLVVAAVLLGGRLRYGDLTAQGIGIGIGRVAPGMAAFHVGGQPNVALDAAASRYRIAALALEGSIRPVPLAPKVRTDLGGILKSRVKQDVEQREEEVK
jgi:hypothetical protein